jgi:hypothetical protein
MQLTASSSLLGLTLTCILGLALPAASQGLLPDGESLPLQHP